MFEFSESPDTHISRIANSTSLHNNDISTAVSRIKLNEIIRGEGHSEKRIFLSSPIKSLY